MGGRKGEGRNREKKKSRGKMGKGEKKNRAGEKGRGGKKQRKEIQGKGERKIEEGRKNEKGKAEKLEDSTLVGDCSQISIHSLNVLCSVRNPSLFLHSRHA